MAGEFPHHLRSSRPATPHVRRRWLGWLSALGMVIVLAGCGGDASESNDAQVNLALDPNPPVVGNCEVVLTLADASGVPVEGAEVQLEGNMNHAGMKPSFADLQEVEPGKYAGTLDFTMGGDWYILVTAETQDGKQIERKIDVRGVEAR